MNRKKAGWRRREEADSTVGTVCFDPATLQKRLTPLQRRVTQEKATERPYSGRYHRHSEPGLYRCVLCTQPIFSSAAKYDSGSGWPSFSDVLDRRRVTLTADLSHVGGNLLRLVADPDLARTEVSCARCGAHLGHRFEDGPKPTGHRYCINSESLDFRRDESVEVPDTKSELVSGSCSQTNGSCVAPSRVGDGAAPCGEIEKLSLTGSGATRAKGSGDVNGYPR